MKTNGFTLQIINAETREPMKEFQCPEGLEWSAVQRMYMALMTAALRRPAAATAQGSGKHHPEWIAMVNRVGQRFR